LKDYSIIAHRGSSYDAPENTLPSINLAWSQNSDAIEVDIHLTKDNYLVVNHDQGTERTGGVKKRISKTNLIDLQNIDVGNWKDTKWKGTKIPTLEEVLLTVKPSKKIFIEIKGGIQCLEILNKSLKKSKLDPGQIVIMDFDIKVVIEAKKIFPKIEVLLLIENGHAWFSIQIKKKIKRAIHSALKYNLDGLNIENVKELDLTIIQKIKENNLKCYCWTVNEPRRAQYLIKNGINGIITNRPKYIMEEVKNYI